MTSPQAARHGVTVASRADLTDAERAGHHALCVYESDTYGCTPAELHDDIDILERAVIAIRKARKLGDIAAIRAWADDLEAQHGATGVTISPAQLRERADQLQTDYEGETRP